MTKTQTKTRTNKTEKKKHIPKGLSINPDLYAQAVERAESLGMSFSEYVVRTVTRDIEKGGDFVIVPRPNQSEW